MQKNVISKWPSPLSYWFILRCIKKILKFFASFKSKVNLDNELSDFVSKSLQQTDPLSHTNNNNSLHEKIFITFILLNNPRSEKGYIHGHTLLTFLRQPTSHWWVSSHTYYIMCYCVCKQKIIYLYVWVFLFFSFFFCVLLHCIMLVIVQKLWILGYRNYMVQVLAGFFSQESAAFLFFTSSSFGLFCGRKSGKNSGTFFELQRGKEPLERVRKK